MGRTKQPQKKEHKQEKRTTKQEPSTPTIAIKDSAQPERTDQIRGDLDGGQPIITDVANFLEGKWINLSRQRWLSIFQIVRNQNVRNNQNAKDLIQKLNEIVAGGASPHPKQDHHGSTRCKYFYQLFNLVLVILLLLLAFLVTLKVSKDLVRSGKFDMNSFFMLNPESAHQWEQLDRKSIHILVTGKTGTGKSALINGLIGDDVTKEGDTLDPTTSEVQEIKQMVHGISLSVFDSPGLQDGTSREQEYLQDMQQKCEKVDLVLYTIRLTDQRIHVEDTDAMKKLTKAFGYNFWKKAMFVMTFANELRSPEYPEDEHENKKYFEEKLQLWKDVLPTAIERRNVIPINIGRQIPIVPTGYYKIRDLPGRKYWFSQFWRAALDRMMESSAEGAGYMLEFSQDRLKQHNDTTEEDFEKPIHEQPILSKIVDEQAT